MPLGAPKPRIALDRGVRRRRLQVVALHPALLHDRREFAPRRALRQRELERRRLLPGLRAAGQRVDRVAVGHPLLEREVAGVELAAAAGQRRVELEERPGVDHALGLEQLADVAGVGAVGDHDRHGAAAGAVEGLERRVDHVQGGEDDQQGDHAEYAPAPEARAAAARAGRRGRALHGCGALERRRVRDGDGVLLCQLSGNATHRGLRLGRLIERRRVLGGVLGQRLRRRQRGRRRLRPRELGGVGRWHGVLERLRRQRLAGAPCSTLRRGAGAIL